MHVELSEAARERVEILVPDGAYPSVEAAVEAAVERLEHPDFTGIDVEALRIQTVESRATGRARLMNDQYEVELQGKLTAIIARKSTS